MNRDQISILAHADHPVASPLSDESVQLLLDGATGRDDDRLLDLGCGGGEWLLRALVARPGVRGEGVDVSDVALGRARDAAIRLGVQDRLELHRQDAARFTAGHRFDLVLCSGATHAFGGLRPTLAAAATHLAAGGRVLIGDGFWDRKPSAEAIEMLGDFTGLAELLDVVVADGWTPVTGHISSQQELDDYEWAWTGSLARWALDHRDHPDHAQVLETATSHRSEWLRVYRDSFGYLSLVLRRTAG